MNMRRLVGCLLLAIFAALLTMSAGAHESGNSTWFQANIQLFKDGRLIASPMIIVEEGRRAEVVIGNDRTGTRLDFTLDKVSVSGEGEPIASFHTQIFEQVDGNWILRAEPSADVYLGTEASISLPFNDAKKPGQQGMLEVTITAVSKDALSSDLIGASPVECEDEGSSDLLAGVTDPQSSCCSRRCNDGSGNTVTCCGAIRCCGCGVCCQVQ